ncbi:hypothetical protein ACOSP7_023494 [Xanthoceras sorbifolium]
MKFSTKTLFAVRVILFIVLISTTKLRSDAFRPLKGEKPRGDHNSLVSFPQERNPVPPYGSSPCTYIPSREGHCHNKSKHD